ncbi:unnamed protein product [Pleuronectes platessa]|uniref:Secreted protein n=1 Tax=Pleuronectes platessa TaxID=8262 RepID=A0A9N7YHT1_PLEPL|nr:unnamed protein product [Pleuronectes platessa]
MEKMRMILLLFRSTMWFWTVSLLRRPPCLLTLSSSIEVRLRDDLRVSDPESNMCLKPNQTAGLSGGVHDHQDEEETQTSGPQTAGWSGVYDGTASKLDVESLSSVRARCSRLCVKPVLSNFTLHLVPSPAPQDGDGLWSSGTLKSRIHHSVPPPTQVINRPEAPRLIRGQFECPRCLPGSR